MGHSTEVLTVPSHIRPDNHDIMDSILTLVRTSLRGNEVLLRVVMDGDPEMGPSNSWEARYSVAWQSESRRNNQVVQESQNASGVGRMRDCGTHIACLNSLGEAMLIWGHCDLDRTTALADCTNRARPAH